MSTDVFKDDTWLRVIRFLPNPSFPFRLSGYLVLDDAANFERVTDDVAEATVFERQEAWRAVRGMREKGERVVVVRRRPKRIVPVGKYLVKVGERYAQADDGLSTLVMNVDAILRTTTLDIQRAELFSWDDANALLSKLPNYATKNTRIIRQATRYALCEPSWATSISRWHIRPLGSDDQLRTSGGITTHSLCGRVAPMGEKTKEGLRGSGGCDLPIFVKNHLYTEHLCPHCRDRYLKRTHPDRRL